MGCRLYVPVTFRLFAGYGARRVIVEPADEYDVVGIRPCFQPIQRPEKLVGAVHLKDYGDSEQVGMLDAVENPG